MGLSAALLSQHGHISSATQPTWAYQQRYSANMGIILSAALLSLRRAYQHRLQPNLGLSAPPITLTWAYQQRYSA